MAEIPRQIAARFTPDSPFNTPRLIQIEPPATAINATIDWQNIFGRQAPLAVEIGCGGGRSLIHMALARPDWNFLGVERAGEYYRMLIERVQRRKILNLRVARTDAAYLLQQFFPEACVAEYHIYFPDPWPKKRHHKRRLFTPAFCAALQRTLRPEGLCYFATDHADYYQELLPRLAAVLEVQQHPQPWPDSPEGRTNFEIKYIKQGRPIYRLVAKR